MKSSQPAAMWKGKTILQTNGLEIRRDEYGVPHIQGEDLEKLYLGLGHCHALDRGMQMLLLRILGSGRLSEFLDPSDSALATDAFFRRLNLSRAASEEAEKLSPEVKPQAEAYVRGINTVLSKKLPWELRLLGYRHGPWRLEDSILLSRMIGYIALSQSQAEVERLLVEMVQAGVDRTRLEELFPGILGGLDEELLRETKLTHRLLPESLRWWGATPRLMASNNWAVSGKKTASGMPILANDPHLEAALPNVWYESVLQSDDRFAISVTIPGLPGIVIGRTPDLAWGVTYTFADTVDSWIEHCREGTYLREGEWIPFRKRTETIRRKGKQPVQLTFHENHHGVLDGDPHQEGFYLATSWSPAASGSRSICAMSRMWGAKDVQEGMELLGQLETSWNWVLADCHGNIGYQMSGLVPRRREGITGFVPLPGWKKENDWNGFHEPRELPRSFNPECGYFATANDDLNRYGKVHPINMPMGPYRAQRIRQLLDKASDLKVQNMFRLQHDFYSLQAERFMAILRPLLPETPQGNILKTWDCSYPADSEGAYLFEQVYRELIRTVFGVGECEVVDFLLDQTGIFTGFFHNFDRILLSKTSAWFRGEDRQSLYRGAVIRALNIPARPWKEHRELILKNLLLGGRLPRIFGFDRGPIPIPGGRATPYQGVVYRSAGRELNFLPSFRTVTDFGSEASYTSMAGGPSDRRFSKWYCSDLKRWWRGEYKKLTPRFPL